jgi:hypothetical protein
MITFFMISQDIKLNCLLFLMIFEYLNRFLANRSIELIIHCTSKDWIILTIMIQIAIDMNWWKFVSREELGWWSYPKWQWILVHLYDFNISISRIWTDSFWCNYTLFLYGIFIFCIGLIEPNLTIFKISSILLDVIKITITFRKLRKVVVFSIQLLCS